MIVIDASVALKWFVVESDSDKAEEVLMQIKNRPSQFAVPDFFYLEMSSVLARIINEKAKLNQIIDDLYNLGFMQLRLGAKLLKSASDLSIQYRLSGYDALYAACAKSLSGNWLTADKKAYSKIASLRLAKLL